MYYNNIILCKIYYEGKERVKQNLVLLDIKNIEFWSDQIPNTLKLSIFYAKIYYANSALKTD